MRESTNGLDEGGRNEQFVAGSNDHQYNLQYTFHPQRREAQHEIVAWDPSIEGDDQVVGHISWHNDGFNKGQINEIYVHPDHRLKGVADRMYLMGKRISATNPNIPEPTHSKTSRTPAGEAWAQKTHDYVPIAKRNIKKLTNWRFSDDYKR